MPHTHHAAFNSWGAAITFSLLLTKLIYARGWVRLRRTDQRVEDWRGASFLLGLLFIWLATASSLSSLDHQLLTVHMIQHLLLMTLAPPLIWLGAPVKTLLYGFPHRLAEASSRLLHTAQMRQLGRAITQPAVCWLAASITLIGWHIPSLFAFGMRSDMWHGIEQVSFLLTGLLFWWPVIRPWSSSSNSSAWAILLYLFLATLPCDILSGFLVFCDRVVYPVYFSLPQLPGFSVLEDQQCAGALMWTCVTVIYLIAGTVFVARLLSPRSARRSQAHTSNPQVSMSGQKTDWTAGIV